MLFVDLLRAAVFLLAAEATALGAIGVIAAQAQDAATALSVGIAWWALALLIGLWTGRRSARSEALRDQLAEARTSAALPASGAARLAVARLWPFGLFAVLGAGLAPLLPAVPLFAAGYALLLALAWRNREATVTAVSERDGVSFYVDDGSWRQPVKLIRTPGLRRDARRRAA